MSKYAVRAAAAMGARAGEKFARQGIPSRNPFDGGRGREELAAAWRRAYFAALEAAGGSR